MNPKLLTEAGNPENQDRGVVIYDGPRIVMSVADGAGGRSGGTEAACRAIEWIRENVSNMHDAESCSQILRDLDEKIASDPQAGETTCAPAVVTRDEIYGASVGDSSIWMVRNDGAHDDFTRDQERKPFIGTGAAWPVSFRHPRQSGCLLLATDGLFKYASAERITNACLQDEEVAGSQLIGLVRVLVRCFPR